ncbi:unnamed protein product [Rhizoctonia solani]|uniref:Transmembrane protein n=1 Tax=Rhizoctonia solani TaxID=456999 RepID=A0A8H7LL51_9AGAM|nr:uncharacterized protein RhiXN_03674 [Rhizoctonia solani]KAF8680926.1 hypothetical protein RHS04_03698 [Rhizoctonia solani]QRW15673.1 hypothetical protein RhiXN_03674 [Rhizoctonia solani]CAE6384337.1 unnamed protein product [Rhizoctonia solani]
MKTFARLFSFIAFLLSVGFLAQALPTTAGNGLAVRDYSTPAGYNGGSPGSGSPSTPSYSKESSPSYKEDKGPSSIDLVSVVVKLEKDLGVVCKELEASVDINAATVAVDKIVIIIKAFVAIIVGVKVDLSVDIKTQIAVQIVACISLIVKALAAVCVRLGADVCVALIAKIDVCIQLLLITINVCVDGILAIIISLCAKLDVQVLAAIKLLGLELLVKICALVKIIGAISL